MGVLGCYTYNTQNLGFMHTKYLDLFGFEPKIPYYIDQSFVNIIFDSFENLQQFGLPLVILLYGICLGHVSNISLIRLMS